MNLHLHTTTKVRETSHIVSPVIVVVVVVFVLSPIDRAVFVFTLITLYHIFTFQVASPLPSPTVVDVIAAQIRHARPHLSHLPCATVSAFKSASRDAPLADRH